MHHKVEIGVDQRMGSPNNPCLIKHPGHLPMSFMNRLPGNSNKFQSLPNPKQFYTLYIDKIKTQDK